MPMPTKAEIITLATELYMKEQAHHEGLGETTPEITELKEGGFWQQALEQLRAGNAPIKATVTYDKDFLLWAEQSYSDYDSNCDREMMKLVAAQNNDFLNCLVLQFNARQYGLAVKMLTAKYKKNMMPITEKTIAYNKKPGLKVRILWFIGSKEQTTKILLDLQEKHNLRPRVLRDSYLRRHNVHYANGSIYKMSEGDFKRLQRKQSVVLLEEEAAKLQTKIP